MSEKIDLLKSMFPNIESSVIGMILENVQFNVDQASELLLDMTDSKHSSSGSPSSGATSGIKLGINETRKGELGDNQTMYAWPKPFASAAKTNGACGPRNSSLGAIGNKISTGKQIGDNKMLQECMADIEKGFKVLVILRGLPGSGKSTLAKK